MLLLPSFINILAENFLTFADLELIDNSLPQIAYIINQVIGFIINFLDNHRKDFFLSVKYFTERSMFDLGTHFMSWWAWTLAIQTYKGVWLFAVFIYADVNRFIIRSAFWLCIYDQKMNPFNQWKRILISFLNTATQFFRLKHFESSKITRNLSNDLFIY